MLTAKRNSTILKAVALYDFIGNKESDELSFRAGDVINVKNTNSDDGWWEGFSKGETGFFPELYVELLSPEDDDFYDDAVYHAAPPAPLPLPIVYSSPPVPDSSSNFSVALAPSPGLSVHSIPAIAVDEIVAVPSDIPKAPSLPIEVDSGFSTPSHHSDASSQPRKFSSSTATAGHLISALKSVSFHDLAAASRDMASQARSVSNGSKSHDDLHDQVSIASRQSSGGTSSTLRRSLNRFSHFVSSGVESFVISGFDESLPSALDRRIVIQGGHNGPEWSDESALDYDLSIKNYVERTKYAGTKHYVSFQVYDSITGCTVLRRFKHFEWLYTVLSNKFTTICLPPLPEKKIQGRFTEEFLDSRRAELERFIRRLARHPLIKTSAAFHLFVTCTDEKAWKAGKRQAESDHFQGKRLLQTIEVRDSVISDDEYGYGGAILSYDISSSPTSFLSFIKNMRLNEQALQDAANGFLFIAPCISAIMVDLFYYLAFQTVYVRMSGAFRCLLSGSPRSKSVTANTNGDWCWKDDCVDCEKLTKSMTSLAEAMQDISCYWDINAKKSCIPIIEQVREYDGLLDAMQSVVELHEKTSSCLKDLQKSANIDELAVYRCQTVLNACAAEINRFHKEKIADFDSLTRSFLNAQVDFHQRMLNKLKEAQNKF